MKRFTLYILLLLFVVACGGGSDDPDSPANQAPNASFTASPLEGQAPLEVSFDASGSSDSDGSVNTFAWDFGDGSTGDGETAVHTFDAAGEYTVTLTVTDDDGATDEVTDTITVLELENIAPVASISATPLSGTAPLEVTFDGSSSADDDGDIAAFVWDFGDGNSGEGTTTQHTYESTGEYTATLTVTDDEGATDTTTVVITVDEPENRVPSVTLEASPTTGNAPLDVTFTATASDPDGDTLSINWDLGNAESLQDSLVQTVFYENAGTYEVSVTVTDGDGASASASITVVVDEPLELPEPRINASSTSVISPNTVRLSCGNNSENDPNDLIDSCTWDFGDGTTPRTFFFDGVNHMFVPGTYTVTVTVNYFDDTTDQATITITARRPADVNCSNFGSQSNAQRFFEATRSPSNPDPYRLDGDNDGRACESL